MCGIKNQKEIRETHADVGPTLAAEKLRERHGIDLATDTVRPDHDRRRAGYPASCARLSSTSRATAAPAWASWCRSTAATTPRSRTGRRPARSYQRRRRHRPVDAAAVRARRIHARVIHRHARLCRAPRQAARVLCGQGQHLPRPPSTTPRAAATRVCSNQSDAMEKPTADWPRCSMRGTHVMHAGERVCNELAIDGRVGCPMHY